MLSLLAVLAGLLSGPAGIALALALEIALLPLLAGLLILLTLLALLLTLLVLLTLRHASSFRACRRMPAAAVSPLKTRLNSGPG